MEVGKSYFAKRLREVLLDGKWIANTNFKEQIIDLDWEKAVLRLDNLNSVALLTFHINYYLAGVLNVLKGGNLEIRDKFSFDMPEIKNNSDWQKLVNEFFRNAEDFSNAVDQLADSKFNEVFVDEKYGTYLRNIEAIIEHSYYHLGQVVLINKMIRERGLSL